jgi:hypothetical protein
MNSPTTRRAWQVERTETVPMTLQQYNFAVTALATLIKQWIHKLETMNQDNEDSAQKQDIGQEQGEGNGAINHAPHQENPNDPAQ